MIFKFKRRLVLPLFASAVLLLLGSGCYSLRRTETQRTALEQALLSTSAKRALKELQARDTTPASFWIDTSHFKGVDENFLLSALTDRLLELGFWLSDEDNADVIVQPRVAYAGTDSSSFIIGIPQTPIPIPAAGTLTIPEIALFKRESQWARNEMALFATERESGKLVFREPELKGDSYHRSYILLILIRFTSTDLPDPY